MDTFQYINIIILNALAWVILSYFWSYWTYKIFKPFSWLEANKTKSVDKKLQKIERSEKDKNRFYQLWFLLKKIEQKNIPGSMAEVGVYKGETAEILHQMLPERKLFLFDSFDGFPHQVVREDCDGNVRPQTVQFDSTSADLVRKKLGDSQNVIIREGIFPETAKGIENETFAFVHLDADLYQSTIDGLQFFYPRLSPSGMIVVHDYNHDWEGVRKAVDEFELTIPESFVPLADMYGSVVIVKNA